ncbi:MAG: pitrilysin family protein, partial [Patescibacteria group bacterium]
MYKKITLPNGLRLILVPNTNTMAVTAMVLVGAGSKYETKQNNGISHFLEHLFFKGTKKRPTALQISETLDKVGGLYNAFTSKELTGYFAKVDSGHWQLALDWVSDIFLHSTLPPQEIAKERGVIIEEINMMLDTPMRFVGELWEELLYGDQPAGWEIIGTKENIASLKRNDFVNYLKNQYSSKNTIVVMAGNFPVGQAEKLIKSHFASINKAAPQAKVATKEKQTGPGLLLKHKATDQTHFCLGGRGLNMFDERKYAQEILATILGGNMSSRLFMEVREKRGLAYYIRTTAEEYIDSGYLMTQAGVPNDKAERAIEVILQQYRKIKEKGVG